MKSLALYDNPMLIISGLAQAVKQISNAFRPYITIPRIAQIWKRIQEVQGRIRGILDEDFDALCVLYPRTNCISR